jgi:hypothetical protein
MSTTVDPINIEEEEGLVFDPVKWIRQGKKYKGGPLHVQNACMAVTRVPEDAITLLPNNDLAILDFTNLTLPTKSAAIDLFPDQKWFDLKEPTISDSEAVRNVLWQRTVPPKVTILKLEAVIGQKWLDGCKSITDPHFDHSKIWLPLWTLKLWRALADILDKRRDWKEAMAFEQITGPMFHPFPSSTMPYQTKAFAHILPHQFLIMLTQKLEKEDGLQVVLRSGDATMFKKLKAGIPQIDAAMKNSI